MKKTFFLCVVLFSLFSCQENIHYLEEDQITESIETRKAIIDCEQNFTPGNIYEGLFGDSVWSYFGEVGWEGTFEEEYFPCSKIIEAGDCCDDSEIREFPINFLPFSPACNNDLDEQELQDLADFILDLSMVDLPVCEDGTILNPVDINVIILNALCCVYEAPCPELDDPCDCYSDYPDDPYWLCCEGYTMSIQVKYARTTACRAVK